MPLVPKSGCSQSKERILHWAGAAAGKQQWASSLDFAACVVQHAGVLGGLWVPKGRGTMKPTDSFSECTWGEPPSPGPT